MWTTTQGVKSRNFKVYLSVSNFYISKTKAKILFNTALLTICLVYYSLFPSITEKLEKLYKKLIVSAKHRSVYCL